jgi:hypothetical protein
MDAGIDEARNGPSERAVAIRLAGGFSCLSAPAWGVCTKGSSVFFVAKKINNSAVFSNHGTILKHRGYTKCKKGLSSFLRRQIIKTEINNNKISTIDDLINIKISNKNDEFSRNLLSEIDLVTYNLIRENQAILTKGTLTTDPWRLKTKSGYEATTDKKIKFTDLEVDTFNVLTDMKIKKGAGSAGDIFSIFRREVDNTETKLFRFDTSGLIISDNIPAGFSDEKLVIGGNIKAEGNIKAGGYVRSYYSDNRLKTFTSNITNALDIIDTLNGFYYVPNEKALQFGFEYDNEIGLSAQEVKKVIPEIVKIAPFDSTKVNEKVVSKSGEEYLTICYERLGPVFVEAIKELRKENKCLKNEIVTIKKDLDNIKKIIYIQ